MYFPGIEVFLAIVQSRSLSKAAEFLHLSQSTVSYRLKNLEDSMGGALVERGKGIATITLTPLGESFATIAERWYILQRETEILQTQGPTVSLTIGAADSLSLYILPPLYQALLNHQPSLQIRLRTQHTLESYESIERRETDIAFVKTERINPHVRVEPFFTDELVVVRLATTSDPLPNIISPESLNSSNELFMGWGPSYQIWHDRWWDPQAPVSIRLDTAGLIFSLLQHPDQWAIVPHSIAMVFQKTYPLHIQRLSDPPPAQVCHIITHAYPKPFTRQGLEIIRSYINTLYPPFPNTADI